MIFIKISEIKEASESYKILKNGVAKADFFRICYIYKYGGFWFDFDMDPVEMKQGYDIEFFDMGYGNISYMLIGAVKKESFFLELINKITENIKNNKKSRGNNIMEITGPHVLQKLLQKKSNKYSFIDGKFKGENEKKFYSVGNVDFSFVLKNTVLKTSIYHQIQKKHSLRHYSTYNYI